MNSALVAKQTLTPLHHHHHHPPPPSTGSPRWATPGFGIYGYNESCFCPFIQAKYICLCWGDSRKVIHLVAGAVLLFLLIKHVLHCENYDYGLGPKAIPFLIRRVVSSSVHTPCQCLNSLLLLIQ